MINFVTYHKKRKHISLVICRLTTLIQKEGFLKTTERTLIEINKLAAIDTSDEFVDTETTICNTKVVSVDQRVLETTFNFPDCSNEVTAGHEDLVDCTCGIMSAKGSCIVNDKVIFSV